MTTPCPAMTPTSPTMQHNDNDAAEMCEDHVEVRSAAPTWINEDLVNSFFTAVGVRLVSWTIKRTADGTIRPIVGAFADRTGRVFEIDRPTSCAINIEHDYSVHFIHKRRLAFNFLGKILGEKSLSLGHVHSKFGVVQEPYGGPAQSARPHPSSPSATSVLWRARAATRKDPIFRFPHPCQSLPPVIPMPC